MSFVGEFSFLATAFYFYCFLILFWEAAAAAKIGEMRLDGELCRRWCLILATGDWPKWLFS